MDHRDSPTPPARACIDQHALSRLIPVWQLAIPHSPTHPPLRGLLEMVRVVLLILVVAEGSGAAENPSKIVWVALMYLVFCLLGTLDAYALRNDML
jgi:hypothetical protein